jgi:DNA-binding LacI/PurR family transcriptional regulator
VSQEPATATLLSATQQRALLRLRELVDEGALRLEAVLPAERELCVLLGVSRTCLRGLLQGLEERGFVTQLSPRKRRLEHLGAEEPQRLPTPIALPATIAVLSDVAIQFDPATFTHRGFTAFVGNSVITTLQRSTWHALVVNPRSHSVEDFQRLLAQRPAGLVVLRERATHDVVEAELAAAARAGVPTVAMAFDRDYPKADRVRFDHAAGAAELTRLVAARGCRRILRVWPEAGPGGDHAWLAGRDRGYLQACAELGLEPLPVLRHRTWPVPVVDAETFADSARHLAGSLLEHGDFDAVMAVTDGLVPTLGSALRRLGRDPLEDCPIVGFDHYWLGTDTRCYEPTPPLATIDKDQTATGQALVELLQARIEGRLPPEPQLRMMPPRLVLREALVG